jgi:predicted O-methyltransferase YrrM
MKFLNFKFFYLWIKYSLSKYSRYKYLYQIIADIKPKKILEIGIYNGKRTKEIINVAQVYNKKIDYYGFDLFEDINKVKINNELSKKPKSVKEINNLIKSNFNNVNLSLIKGDTKITLKKFLKKKIKIDFVFIDGGHSLSTIRSDWQNIKQLIHNKSVIVFDDYYHDKEIIKKFGCNKIINDLDKSFSFQVLPSSDYISEFNKYFKNSLVKVTKKKYE